MKKILIKASLASTLLLATSIEIAQAHCIGPLSANFATATIAAPFSSPVQFDMYEVTCPATTQSLRARISKAATGTPNAPFIITIDKSGFPQLPQVTVSDTTATATTQCDGANNESIGAGASPFTSLNGGSGAYQVIVSKNSNNSTYAAELHCHQGLNGTGTEDTPVPTAAGLDFDRPVDN